ncbi:PP2C family protein-serine/threonine phosphatase [Compostimonas suwonensis]|uniref:PP2C family protein-serine/threonine phosphatase n=1 Tax=Compostimonas suwonensis TaxID=1048394 RepID=UPI001FE312A7|nr:protein phosphatase 2C domain-containing protein [Compostimonas suwonensis]
MSNHTVVVPGRDDLAVTLSWAARTDTGHRRAVNEDSFLARSPLFAVADGMGGHSAGDFASAAVVTRLAENVGHDYVEPGGIDRALRAAVDDIGKGAGESELGTGTTVTGIALTLIGGTPQWVVFNIGDSRVYQLVEGVLEQLTVDHSVVQELIDAGAIRPEDAEGHPHSNVITRSVGFNDVPDPDFRVLPVIPGMRILICSDGLTKELTDYGIRHFLVSNPDPDDAADHLIDAALDNGGRDNVTVVVVDVEAQRPTVETRSASPRH